MRVLSFWGICWVSWLQSSLQSSHMTQQNFFEVVQNQKLWELEYDWNLQLCGSLMSEHHHHHLHFAGCLMGFKILASRCKPTCSHIVYFESSWDCCGCCQKHLVIIQRRICRHFAFWMPCGFLCSVSVPILQSTLQIVWGFYALSKDVQSIANVGCLLSSDYWIAIPKSWSKVSNERTIQAHSVM
jgi:hypothetical protein